MPFDRLHCITSTYFGHHVVAFDAFFFVHGASQKVGTTRLPYRLRLINRIAKPSGGRSKVICAVAENRLLIIIITIHMFCSKLGSIKRL